MKGPLVCFLLLAATFAAATEWEEVPPTYGECPAPTHVAPNAYYCMANRPCPGDEKCCQVHNIMKCVLPKGVHQGYCPRPQDQAVYKKPCAGDHQCGWHEKCCLKDGQKKCVQAVPDIKKPGTCPPPVQDEDKRCGKYCSSDAKCPGIERCCPTSCGQECRIPQRYMPGYCPAVLLPPSRGDVCFRTCTNDFDCNHGIQLPLKKCCDFEGRKICVDNMEEHPGVCLRRVEVQPFVPCNDTCDDDQDCPLTEKCCFTGCGRGCLPSVRSEVCQLPMAQGSCKKSLTRFYYDPEKKKCVSFIYRDCEGNRNNFETKELCEKACGEISKEVCRLPKETGPCQGFSMHYYHNWETKKCEMFAYGLCGGNENRFSTKLECEMVCGGFGKEQE
ncbi:PREDICTED: WAP four-disulfide core domain protein 8-like [Thamnophis sirtalis]|uniref:WAP four-disulfide core domain protein 8-like n=1 Tax=Thamnophis sirtalis TaxID=35019 RepID=A0A6I9X6N7_9SAUR|nr:PREDICTED: WAP four-disulfide core domain protein 8-like [Thamnophis sirtalis]